MGKGVVNRQIFSLSKSCRSWRQPKEIRQVAIKPGRPRLLGALSNSGLAVRLYSEGRQPAHPKTVTGDVMAQYLVAIYHPDDYDPSVETEATTRRAPTGLRVLTF